MKIHKSTPLDMLKNAKRAKNGHCSDSLCYSEGCDECPICQGCEKPLFIEAPLQAGHFYLKARFVCPQCDHEEDVVINKDNYVDHECNQGNVHTKVPTISLPETNFKLLEAK